VIDVSLETPETDPDSSEKGKRQSKHKLDERGILLITNAERPRQLG
jgi:hypothetical protein